MVNNVNENEINITFVLFVFFRNYIVKLLYVDNILEHTNGDFLQNLRGIILIFFSYFTF